MSSTTRRQALQAVLLASLGATTMTASAETNLVATAARPAVAPIASTNRAGLDLLDVHIRAFTPPRRGSVEAVVSLGPAGKEVEVGRFAIFPSEAFHAASPAQHRTFRLNAGEALSAARDAPLVATLRLEPTDDKISAEGASLTLDRVELVRRPAP